MSSIFTKIISGEILCHKIAENESFFAFLDIMPLAPGHTLVVPKIETDYIFDLPQILLEGLLPFAKNIAFALEQALPCKRVGISVIGLEVPHAHLHLIPLRSLDDINFSQPKMVMSNEELAAIAKQILRYLP